MNRRAGAKSALKGIRLECNWEICLCLVHSVARDMEMEGERPWSFFPRLDNALPSGGSQQSVPGCYLLVNSKDMHRLCLLSWSW